MPKNRESNPPVQPAQERFVLVRPARAATPGPSRSDEKLRHSTMTNERIDHSPHLVSESGTCEARLRDREKFFRLLRSHRQTLRESTESWDCPTPDSSAVHRHQRRDRKAR